MPVSIFYEKISKVLWINTNICVISAQTANVFYEANRRAVLDMLNPTIEEYTESVVKNIFNEVFSSTPYEDMFS